MRYTSLFGKTYRKVPQAVKSQSYIYLLRGGFIRPVSRGLFSFLPLGVKVLENIKNIIQEEMVALGGQEVIVPFVSPYSIWKRSGRALLIEKELIKFNDRTGHDLVLSPTHEEAMVELVRSCINSYRDLPVFLFQIQNKFRDEERTRLGLIRTKEFLMKDAYSFHRSFSDLNNFFPKVYAAYQRIFDRCSVPVLTAESGVGFIGGEKSYEFLMEAEFGEDVLILCNNCGYRANREVAVGVKHIKMEKPVPMTKQYTPHCTTMETLSAHLNLPKSKLAKAMVYKTIHGYVMALVLGNHDVSTEKLARILKTPVIRKANREELEGLGLLPGFLSPVGELKLEIPVVADDAVANSANLVYGSNTPEMHYLNINFGRDYETEHVGDIAMIGGENLCKQCGHEMEARRVVELGDIFKLGDFYTRAMNLSFQNDNGIQVFPYMGAYGIGIGRLMAAIVESNHDEKGIIWPSKIAPFKAFLMGIGKSLKVKQTVEKLHADFSAEVLLDDRLESPGVKFQDADLLGIPLRIVVSPKHLRNGKIEFHDRGTEETWLADLDTVEEVLKVGR